MSEEVPDKGRMSRRQRGVKAFFSHAILMLLTLTTVAPFVWMVLCSFKPLAEVEKMLGLTLFTRSTRGTEPTPAGESLVAMPARE